MNRLLNENISLRVLRSIIPVFPGSIHVSKEGSNVKEDQEIFDFTKGNEFTILTFDEDFYDLQLLKGHPPKIIWLRFGNSNNLKNKLIENRPTIGGYFGNLLKYDYSTCSTASG